MISTEEYLTAIERINKQLYRLEKYAKRSGEKITDYAYKLAMYDIKDIFGYTSTKKERKRFSKKLPLTKTGTLDQKHAMKVMNAINRFYDLPTAKISGMKEIYEKRAQTLSEKRLKIGKFDKEGNLIEGQSITGMQLKKLFDSGLWDQLTRKGKYTSKTAMRIIGQLIQDKEHLLEQIDKNAEKIVVNDSIYNKKLGKLFADNPDKLEEFLSGL